MKWIVNADFVTGQSQRSRGNKNCRGFTSGDRIDGENDKRFENYGIWTGFDGSFVRPSRKQFKVITVPRNDALQNV